MATTTQPIHSENISPRARFQMSATKLGGHRDLIQSEAFRAAIDTALLQYQTELSGRCTDANAAMRIGLSIVGAQEFVTVLRKLADKDELPTVVKPNDNLPIRGN